MLSLQNLGVGCSWQSYFTGALCYADDLALLAPSASALQLVLHECEAFAVSRGLKFNSAKTQLIHFGRCQSSICTDCFLFCGAPLPCLDSVIYLGHTLKYDLGDEDDIALRTRDMIRKANCIMRTFQGVDPVVMTCLFHSFCLSLYGSTLWNLSCKAFRIVEVAFNSITIFLGVFRNCLHILILQYFTLLLVYKVCIMLLLRGSCLSRALLITVPLPLFNMYFVTLSPPAILFLDSTPCMGHDTLSIIRIKI